MKRSNTKGETKMEVKGILDEFVKEKGELHNQMIIIGKGIYRIVKKHEAMDRFNNMQKVIEDELGEELDSEEEEKDRDDSDSSSSSDEIIEQSIKIDERSKIKMKLQAPLISIGSPLLKTPLAKRRRKSFRLSIKSKKSAVKSKYSEIKQRTFRKLKTLSAISRDTARTAAVVEQNHDELDFDFLDDIDRMVTSDPGEYFSSSNLMNSLNMVKLPDFEFLSKLGEGSYGKVYLVRHIATGDFYAMKVIGGSKALNKTEIDHILNEREIFNKIQNEFCVNALASFVYKNLCIFVIELMLGGDLDHHILGGTIKLQSETLNVYLGQIILGLEALHEAGIVHRDIKPGNILVGKDGYLKLTDYGLSDLKKTLDEQKLRPKGSVKYMAPENFLRDKEIGYEVDWFALGVVAFNLIKERFPYDGTTVDEVVLKIVGNDIDWEQPGEEEEWYQFSPELKDLIQKLLEKDPKKRLGHNGAEEIKNHPYFKTACPVIWENLKKKKYYMYPVEDVVSLERFKKEGVKYENMKDYVEREFKEVLYNDQIEKEILTLKKSKFELLKIDTLCFRNDEVGKSIW
jgi:serine/threonine protein kinase